MDHTPIFRLSLPAFDYEPWDDEVNDNFRILDASLNTIIGLPGFVGLWANALAYVVGQTVIDEADSTVWTCDVGHTSAASPTTFAADRTAHPTYWTRVYNSAQDNADSALQAAADAEAAKVAACNCADAAAVSQTAAAASEASATTSASTASSAATSATTSASNAASSAAAAHTSEVNAAGSASSAAGSAAQSQSALTYVSDTAPVTPADRSLWFDSAGLQLYIRYNDGSSTQWVVANNAYGSLPDAPTDGLLYGRKNSGWTSVASAVTGVGSWNGRTGVVNMIGTDVSDAGGLLTSGGTMTGALTLNADPAAALQAAPKQYVDARVAKAGDTMTGNLTISTTNYPAVCLNSPAALQGDRQVLGLTGGKNRWVVSVGSNEAESGSNAGSNFSIARFNDAGTYLGSPFSINRANGNVTVAQGLTASTVTATGNVFANNALYAANGAMWIGEVSGYRYIRFATDAWGWQWNTSNGQLAWTNNAGAAKLTLDGGGGLWTAASMTSGYIYSTGDIDADGTCYAGVHGTRGQPNNAARIRIQNGNLLQFRWDGSGFYMRLDESLERKLMWGQDACGFNLAAGYGGPTNIALQVYNSSQSAIAAMLADSWSDARVKRNIADSEINATALLEQVPVRSYDFKREYVWGDEKPKSDIHVELGLVAQEVADVFPDLVAVSQQPDASPLEVKDIQFINNKGLVPYLLRAVQELSARVRELEGQRHAG